MKIKDYFLSIILYSFLGYLFSLFVVHIIDVVYQSDHPIMLGIPVSLVGLLIFSEIIKRSTDFNVSAFHPVKIVGYISMFTIILAFFYFN